MSNETKAHLIAILLRHGQSKLGECLDVSASEISKKINGDNGWTLEQLAKAFDYVDAQIIPGDETVVVMKRDEVNALRTLAKKSLQQDTADALRQKAEKEYE